MVLDLAKIPKIFLTNAEPAGEQPLFLPANESGPRDTDAAPAQAVGVDYNGIHEIGRSFDATRQKLPKSISDIEPSRVASAARDWSASFDEIDPFKHDPQEVIEKYRKRMSPFPRSLLIAGRLIFPDKSNALYAMITELVRLAATNDEIASALRENPHFTHRDGMTLDALCADILRIRAKWEGGQ